LKGGGSGFVYSDAQVDDSRLTLLNAMDARANGAEIRTQVALDGARREGDMWRASLSDGSEVTARSLVNAAGPWVHLLLDRLGRDGKANVRLVKGSHIVVPKLYEGDHAYIVQLPDRRIIFAIPWQGGTEIGTTDIPVDAPEDAVITADEIAYLCDGANHHFRTQISPGDVIHSWSGVRPLYDDGASDAKAVTRDYVLELDTDGPPLLSVFGGKITTGRHLAEDAMGKLGPSLGIAPRPVSRARVFPGGAIADFDQFLAQVRTTWPFLGDERSQRMAHAYGTMLGEMLADVADETGLGTDLGGGLTEIEARWMRDHEWARSASDALDRRSKIGLHLAADERAAFEKAWDALT
jgi:glycerol-3-phosphate dehydrogenase